MNVNEYAKPVAAPGFFARLFGQTVNSYALAIVFGAESVEKVAAELVEAKAAIKEWIAKRNHKDFVMVTAFAPQPICDAIDVGITKICREDSDVAPLLKGIPVELSFNATQKKTSELRNVAGGSISLRIAAEQIASAECGCFIGFPRHSA